MSEVEVSPALGSRRGMNPSRTKRSSYRPARVTAAVLVHIPHQVGYYEHRLSVLEACLTSLIENAGAPFDLLVFDNASCRAVQEYLQRLQDRGRIQFLLRAHTNLGKIGALQIIFRAAPGELVAYSDDDFYFHPGWLEQQLRILESYPKVGMVSGYALPSFFGAERVGANLEFAAAKQGVRHREGKFIPEVWIRDWALSTGRDPEAAVQEQAAYREHLLELDQVSAYAAANHDQFLAPKALIEACLPDSWSGNLMGDMLALDRAVNDAGYLRLSTTDLTAQHLGNRMSATSLAGVPAGAPTGGQETKTGRGRWSSFLRWKPVRFVLLGIYSKLFRLVNPE